MPPLHFAQSRTHDAHQHATGLDGWQQQYEQLSSGTFAGEIEDLRLGPVQVFHERVNRTVFEQGRPRPDSVTVAHVAVPAEAAWFCGHTMPDDHEFVMPADGEFEFTATAGTDLVAVCIACDQLCETAQRLRTEAMLPSAPGPSAGRGAEAHALRDLALCAIELARCRPELLDKPAARAMLVRSLSEAMLQSLALPETSTALPRGAAAQQRIVSRARGFVREHPDEPISVPQLCAVTGVSRRALQYAFDHVLHVSPVTYVRAVRLNHVRAALVAGSTESIGDLAARWGFWHLSRFAAEYRELFGELPSATRARHGGAEAKGALRLLTA